jgi:hypothetical protein
MEWIEIKDLGRTDSAICNETEREHFFDLIGNENIKFIGLTDNTASQIFLAWICDRRLHVTNIVFDVDIPSATVTKILPIITKLEVLVIHADSQYFRDDLFRIIKIGSKLTELHLSNCSILNDSVLIEICDICKLLRKVYFPFISIIKPQMRLTDASIVHMSEQCSDLEVVCLKMCGAITCISFASLLANCSKLSELTMCKTDQ